MIGPLLIGLLGCCLLCMFRVIRGPTLLDRIAAADAIGLFLTVVLVLLGHVLERSIFLDIAMVYALLLFADVLVIARHLHQDARARDG